MLPNTNIDLENISGIGPKYQLALKKLGIVNAQDLIYFLPKKIIDLTEPISIEAAKNKIGQEVVIEARIKSVNVVRTKFKRMWIVEAILEDEGGAIEAVWYNQPYLFKAFKKDAKERIFKSVVTASQNKIFLNNPEIYQAKGLYPIYRQTKNLSSKIISKIVKKILVKSLFKDDLIPGEVRERYVLPDLFEAAKLAHFPRKSSDFPKGKHRFLFEELFLFMLVNLKIKQQFDSEKAPAIKHDTEIEALTKKLPFHLTTDQETVLKEVLDDLATGRPMNRIIQGDVGSGKTVVAFLAMIAAAFSDCQSALLAPTEILAMQHYQTYKDLIAELKIKNIEVGLVTSKNKIIPTKPQILIGTHALFNYKFKNLGLVVVDEQQRFGVEQRLLLMKGNHQMPHYLSLSATPIPRSLAHVIFSNCDLSIIKEKPKGRQKIETFLVPETKRQGAYKFIDDLVAKGERAFIVCPLIINDGLYDDKKSVESQAKLLKKTILGKRKIGVLHGKMKAEAKEKVIGDFRQGKVDILVSTSVVEVGVDVPDATAMIIEDAQMFGLASLHQFRGRVGRSALKSYCLLFAKIESELTKRRLKAFVQHDDGFELSSLDLKLRGPGAFFDINQSGFSGINPLWFEDSELLNDCRQSAQWTLKKIDDFPYLKSEVESRIQVKHLN